VDQTMTMNDQQRNIQSSEIWKFEWSINHSIKVRIRSIQIKCFLPSQNHCSGWYNRCSDAYCSTINSHCQGVDSRVDFNSPRAILQMSRAVWLDFVRRRFEINADWILCLFIIESSVNCDSVQCWNSWTILFSRVQIIFINFIWILITLESDRIICIFTVITSINCDSSRCLIYRWFCILRCHVIIMRYWKREW
jgi:hypothetical protein